MLKIFLLSLALVVLSVSADAQYDKKANWDRFSGGALNISVFVFRDRNRNGIYDVGDRPMANIAVDLIGPVKTSRRRSNISGFANFKKSVLKRDDDIVNRGMYEYHTHVPPGWVLTTGNLTQKSFFEVIPGTPADMISSTPAQPVGLAADLYIEGKLSDLDGDSGTKLSVIFPTGEQRPITIHEGRFEVPAFPGDWQIAALNPRTGERLQRHVTVIDTPVHLSDIRTGIPSADRKSNKTLVNFDDAIQTTAVLEIPSGYGGVGWQNWVITHNRTYSGEGYINSTVSGEYVAYNSSGNPVKITSDKAFDFEGGFFGMAWSQSEGETLTVKAWRADELVHEDKLILSALGPLYFAAGYRNITRVEFATRHFWQFVADDLQINLGD